MKPRGGAFPRSPRIGCGDPGAASYGRPSQPTGVLTPQRAPARGRRYKFTGPHERSTAAREARPSRWRVLASSDPIRSRRFEGEPFQA